VNTGGNKMKRIVSVTILIVVVSSILCGIVAATQEPFGPAPSSGDSIPDGPGFDDDWANVDAPGDSYGPAPGSGDGISDGPEWP
jgi:hypothetical protein